MSSAGDVNLATLIAGFMQAHDRFEEARRDRFNHAPAYWALFETLAWTYSIDEWFGDPKHHARKLHDQPELRALRYARASVHHRWVPGALARSRRRVPARARPIPTRRSIRMALEERPQTREGGQPRSEGVSRASRAEACTRDTLGASGVSRADGGRPGGGDRLMKRPARGTNEPRHHPRRSEPPRLPAAANVARDAERA
jgi:hypothetical protein